MRPWDHQDVGDLAQWAVIRSLAPHLLWGQRAALQRRAAWDVIGTRALSRTTFSLPHRPAENKELCPVICKTDSFLSYQGTWAGPSHVRESILNRWSQEEDYKEVTSFFWLCGYYIVFVHHTTEEQNFKKLPAQRLWKEHARLLLQLYRHHTKLVIQIWSTRY